MKRNALADLRELAEEATPGPWEVGRTREHGVFTVADVPFGPTTIAGSTTRIEDARYIAALSPEVVTALVAVAEAAEVFTRDQAEGYVSLNDYEADERALTDALDALVAVLQ